jgi:UDP-N-acetylglucosamine acyltransferase
MIHPTAVVDPGADVAADCQVGPLTYIEAGARIGAGCVIGPHVTIFGCTTLGDRCTVHAGAVLGDLPQDLGYAGASSRVEVGADCVIREGVTIHRGTEDGTVTRTGTDCFLMANSHLAHNVVLGDRVILANGVLLGGHVRVDDGAFISGNTVVHQFIRIGRVAMLGGGAALTQDVLPFCMTTTCARNSLAGLNVVGMRRAGLSPAERSEVKRLHKLIFRSGLNMPQALAALDEDGQALASEMASFIRGAKKGICGSMGIKRRAEG